MHHAIRTALGIVSLASLLLFQAQPAQSDIFPGSSNRYLSDRELAGLTCSDLWVARNEIYARNGYCFRSRKAINYFGNAGCWTRNPPLNRIERANIARIRTWERRLGCQGVRTGRRAPPPPATVGNLWNRSCQELWVMRNSIYKRNGYCFRTRRAISYFGNAGCWTTRPRLSAAEQRLVRAIRRIERAKGCR